MALAAATPVPLKLVSMLTTMITVVFTATMKNKVAAQGEATWCVARSDATDQAMQTALDYACGAAGADCIPIQSNGLCYLPNTLQAHASYAFNSIYQHKARAPGSCDFAGTSTIAETDPSYGSCEFPSSVSTAGGTNTPSTTPAMNNPNVPIPMTTTPTFGGDGSGGLTPGMNPDNSRAPTKAITTSIFVFFSSLLILSQTS